jgi:hypothetical protein
MEGGWVLLPVGGGEPRPCPGLESEDSLIRWSADGLSVFVQRFQVSTMHVFRVDLATRRRTPLWQLAARDPTGTLPFGVCLTPDGKSYAYSFVRDLSELYLVEGLR